MTAVATEPHSLAIKKSCLDCPSYLRSDEAVHKFGKSVGAPVCGTYGHILGKPGMKDGQAKKIAQETAKGCPSFGDRLPPLPRENKMVVTLPDPDAREELAEDAPARTMCNSCQMCANFVPAEAVHKAFGWTAPLCRARGQLLLSNKLVVTARNCEYRRFGQQNSNVDNLHPIPLFDDAFGLSADPIKAYFKSKSHFVDPKDWPTDREVTSEEYDTGVGAWRRVVDPDGSGNEVFLPIYRGSFFSEQERALIPQAGDDEHPELYIDHFGGTYAVAVMWTELDETPALWGMAGTGKTELYRYLAWLMQLPFERISITASTELDDIAGKMLFEPDKGTHFQYGRIPKAWAKPCVICLDEPNVGPSDVWQFIRPLTDNSKQLVLDMNSGERIKRHTDAYLGMAMNPAWDPLNVGALSIADADVSRLQHIEVGLPPEELEREIIANRVRIDGWEIDSRRLDMLMGVAKDLRPLCPETIPMSWGIRPQLKVARALRWFEPEVAYRRAVGDFLEPQARDAMLDVVRNHVV